MNRAMRRLTKASLRSGMRQPWQPFERLSESERPELWARQRERVGDLVEVHKNNVVLVQVYRRQTERGDALQLVLRRHDEEPIEGWDVLQRTKNEIVGAHRSAIEIYPPEDEVINQANLRHLFVMPEGERALFTINGRWR